MHRGRRDRLLATWANQQVPPAVEHREVQQVEVNPFLGAWDGIIMPVILFRQWACTKQNPRREPGAVGDKSKFWGVRDRDLLATHPLVAALVTTLHGFLLLLYGENLAAGA